jgi:hypothetical protein
MKTRLSTILQQILVTVATVILLFGGYTAWAAPPPSRAASRRLSPIKAR